MASKNNAEAAPANAVVCMLIFVKIVVRNKILTLINVANKKLFNRMGASLYDLWKT